MADEKQPLASIPLAEETAEVSKSVRHEETVRVTTSVDTNVQHVEAPLSVEQVSVQRLPVGQWVDGPLSPRVEGDTTVFPVVEEVAVVEKRYRLIEEVRVTRHRRAENFAQDVEVRRTRVSVDRSKPTPSKEQDSV